MAVLLEAVERDSRKRVKKPLDTTLVKSILSLLDAGLVSGIGDAKPGEMCVEAAVAYAMGEKHNDHPTCVNNDLCGFKIELNDEGRWHDELDRAAGLRRLAIAQLGSGKKFNYTRFLKLLAARVSAVLVPMWEQTTGAELERLSWDVFNASTAENVKDAIDSLTCMKDDFVPKPRFGTWDMTGHDTVVYISNLLFDDDMNTAYHWFCEEAVQVLIQMKVPGTKFLKMAKPRKFSLPKVTKRKQKR